ncbi:hypothetical protein GW17_00003245 [Ensete ventricosum]|nr:hypothetical protein GW17_00003245 [Ensete ventricosum]
MQVRSGRDATCLARERVLFDSTHLRCISQVFMPRCMARKYVGSVEVQPSGLHAEVHFYGACRLDLGVTLRLHAEVDGSRAYRLVKLQSSGLHVEEQTSGLYTEVQTSGLHTDVHGSEVCYF